MFVGDVIQLIAAVRDEPVPETTADLQRKSLIELGSGEATTYLQRVCKQERLHTLFEQQRTTDRILRLSDVFDSINCRFGFNTIAPLMPHALPLTRYALDNAEVAIPKSAKPVLKWWSQRRALAIPAWQNAEVVGLFLITVNGSNYLPLTDRSVRASAFALVPSFTDPFVVCVDDIVSAVRMTVWSIIETGRPVGFVKTYGVKDCSASFQAGSTIYWSPHGNVDHYIRAVQTPSARALDNSEFDAFDPARELPFGGSFGMFQRRAREARSAHHTLAAKLLEISPSDARAALATNPLDAHDKAKLLVYGKTDSHYLLSLFEDFSRDPSIDWNGNSVVDTPRGWVCQGRVVSSAKLYIEKVKPSTVPGEGTVWGSVSYMAPNGERYHLPFKESISTLVDGTSGWMRRFVFSKTGFTPYISRSWGSALYDMAQQFHCPEVILEGRKYGWADENKLLMPHFMVTAEGIVSGGGGVIGPTIQRPEPLSPSEWGAFKSPGFCRIMLVLLGNMLRTRAGRTGMGIMLKNEDNIISRLASTFGCEVCADPDVNDIEEAATSPLPLFTEWSVPKMREMFDYTTGYRNIVISVTSHVAQLAKMNPDWVHLRVGDAVDYAAFRSIFSLLVTLMRQPGSDLESGTFYRDIADVLLPEVKKECPSTRLHHAALDLDSYYSYRSGTAGSRIMEQIFYGIKREEIRPDYTSAEVSVNIDEFMASLADPQFPLPDISELTARLRDARYLIAVRGGSWVFSQSTWSMHESLSCM